MHRQSIIRSAAALSVVLALGTARGAAAQTTPFDPRWQAFIGCWQSGASVNSGAAVCVTPTSNPAAVQIATVDKGVVVARDTVDPSGRRQAVNKQGCAGFQNARWSADNHRVYITSDLTCTGGLKRTASGVMAMSTSGEWLDIQSVNADGGSGVRVEHFRDATSMLTALPAEFANLNAGRAMAVSTARVAAAGALSVADLADAVKQLDTAVVQAWIVERGARFKLDPSQLIALANAGVPGSVTDIIIGVSYPDHFALRQRPVSAGYADEFSRADSARIAARYINDRCVGTSSLWYTPGIFDPCAFNNGYGLGRYGYNGYNGYGYNNGYGYSPYGYGYNGYNGYGGYYTAPVVVVKGDDKPQTHGRVVNGRGYSGGSEGSGSGVPRSGASGSAAPSSGSTAGSSGSSGSSGDSGRTAHPRPPV